MLRIIKFWILLLVLTATLASALVLGEIQNQERKTHEDLSSDVFVSFLRWSELDRQALENRVELVAELAQHDAVRGLAFREARTLPTPERLSWRNEAQPEAILNELLASVDGMDMLAPIAVVVGSAGQIIGTTSPAVTALHDQPEVRRALLRGSACDGVEIIAGKLHLTAAAPIVYSNELIIGALWLAEPFSGGAADEELAYDVLVLSNMNLVGSTLTPEEIQALGSLPAIDARTMPVGRAGPVELMQRGERLLAGIPTVLREPTSEQTPALTAMVVVEAELVPVTWASFQDRVLHLDLMDPRLWTIAGSGLLLFVLSTLLVSLDGRLLRRRVDRRAREDEAERLKPRAVFEPDSKPPAPKPKPEDTPALSSLRASASAKRAARETEQRSSAEEQVLGPESGFDLSKEPPREPPKRTIEFDEPPATPAARVIKRVPSGALPRVPDPGTDPVFPPTPDDFADSDEVQAIDSPFGSGFDDSSEVPLIPTDAPADPMFNIGPGPSASLDPGPSVRPDWLLTSDGKSAPKRPEKPPITVPVEPTNRDQMLRELLGNDSGPLESTTDESPAPFELSADTILDESTEHVAADPYRELFGEFKTARVKCGLDIDHLDFEDFRQKVLKKEADFKNRHKCDAVILEVFIKEGRVGLKARPA